MSHILLLFSHLLRLFHDANFKGYFFINPLMPERRNLPAYIRVQLVTTSALLDESFFCIILQRRLSHKQNQDKIADC